jgi:short subunit dehydrogenase-like uncharacterized protein
MADSVEWMIYGANGYTGHLVAIVEARRRGPHPVLAGREGPASAFARDRRSLQCDATRRSILEARCTERPLPHVARIELRWVLP